MTDDALQALAPVLGRVPSGLFILTAANGDRETGLLASWVMQCSFTPPRLSVCIRSDREICAWLSEGASFTLNLIGEEQSSFLGHFGKGFALGQPAFMGLKVDRLADEGPILTDAVGYLLCRVQGRYNAGDHELFVATIVDGGLQKPNEKPMVHIRKSGLRY